MEFGGASVPLHGKFGGERKSENKQREGERDGEHISASWTYCIIFSLLETPLPKNLAAYLFSAGEDRSGPKLGAFCDTHLLDSTRPLATPRSRKQPPQKLPVKQRLYFWKEGVKPWLRKDKKKKAGYNYSDIGGFSFYKASFGTFLFVNLCLIILLAASLASERGLKGTATTYPYYSIYP